MKLRILHGLVVAALGVAPALALSAETEAVPVPAVADEVIRFEISRFEIQGNTLLPAATVDSLLAPYNGKQRDFGDVQRALETLEGAYRARGYTLVRVALPEQEMESGVVRLTVQQTRIGKVTVSGNQYFDDANIRRSQPGLVEGGTPNLTALSASLRQANDNPARKITMKLAGNADDTVDARLEVQDERTWKVMFNGDNTGTSETGKTHAGVVLQNANLWGRDHVASLQYTTTVEEPGRVSVYGIGYHLPLYALGDSMDFYGSYSNVDSGNVAAGTLSLAVSGKGAVFGARYNHVLAKRGDYAPQLVYGIDYKAYKNNVELFGIQLGNDVTVHPLSINYLGEWSADASQASGSATLVQNVAGGKQGGTSDFEAARTGAKAYYTLLRLAGSYAYAYQNDWQVRAIANAQFSADALVPGEQFGIGGAASVRGFGERAAADDSGASLNAELYTPNLCAGLAGWNVQCRALGFVDAGWIKRNHVLPGELGSTSIASSGLGMRVLRGRNINLQLDYGHVQRAGATGETARNRLHLRFGLAY